MCYFCGYIFFVSLMMHWTGLPVLLLLIGYRAYAARCIFFNKNLQTPKAWNCNQSPGDSHTKVTQGPWYENHANHDDVIKWKHFPRYWPYVRGIHRSPVNSPHKGQWRRALMFSLICAWINGWVNNRDAGDLRRYRAHYDVTAMVMSLWIRTSAALVRRWLYSGRVG